MNTKLTSAILLSYVFLEVVTAGCNNSSTPPPPPPPPNITVSVSSSSAQVEAGGTAALTGSASGDPANKGVTWSLSPASGAGNLSNITASSATYNAPATPPSSDLMVTITGTAVSNPANSNSVVIDVPAITVSATASLNPVAAGGTSLITAMVNNDPSNKGVSANSWTITPATGAGTLSNPSGTSVTYTAPPMPPPSDTQVVISANSESDSTKSGSVTITFAAIAVSLSANPFSLQAAATSQITATVDFDPANAGVNPASWTISSPTSGGGSLSNPTSTSVTYTAPSTPPVSNTDVTITAVAMSDPTKSGSTTVTVLAITMSLSPNSAIIPLNVAQAFTATVVNDSANAGVNWSITQNGTACSTCGTVLPSSTLSGVATTYTAPGAVPNPATVTVTATSVTDTTKSQSATVTVTNGTVEIVPASLNFGFVKTNQTASRTIALNNTGTSALTMNSLTFSGINPAQFSVTANTCGSSVAAGASCSLTVTFKPAAAIAYSAILNISDSSADSPQQVILSGHGRAVVRFSGAAVSGNIAPTAPVPTGPAPVGTQVIHLIDPTRNDPFLNNGTARELLVRLWYPAFSTAQDCMRAEYTSPRVWSDFSRLIGVPLPHVTTNSCWNASITAGVHPVLIFTHGYTGTFTDYTFLFEELASRGYVVASVDHTYEATAVEFPDGRLSESVFGSHLGNTMRSDAAAMDFAVSVRLNDLKFVINALESLNATDADALAGKLDMSRLAIGGHSLGGLTAVLATEQDARIRAAVILDGVVPGALKGTETPMLFLAAGRDTWSPDETRLWSSLSGARVAVNLRGAEHVTLSDAVWLMPGAVKTGTMGPDKTVAAIRGYVAAFLDAHLLGKPADPLLSERSSKFPDAAVTKGNEPLRIRY